MRMAADLEAAEGIARATAVMATPANLAMLAEAGIAADAPGAGPNDLVVVVEGEGATSPRPSRRRAGGFRPRRPPRPDRSTPGGARRRAAWPRRPRATRPPTWR